MTHKQIIGYAIAGIGILFVGLATALPTINQFPAFIHAWAQADWYSLAIGFQNNGFDFFHPETLIYNKQFPGRWRIDDFSTITSVDFPIHVYIISLLMKLFGTTDPWVFRTWTLLISIAGLWLLFLMCHRLTDNITKSLVVVGVALTSPLYAYYFNNFLPSAPALAFVFSGLWAYVVYCQERKRKYWYLAVFFLTLATLIRTSQAVPLIAVCCFEVFKLIFSKERTKFDKMQILPVVISIVVIGVFFKWNAHLRAENGSLFLNNLQPAQDWDDVHNVFEQIHKDWQYRYFSRPQYWLVAATIIGAIAIVIKRRKKLSAQSLVWLAAVYMFGTILFFVAMFNQYHDHDYYFLDSFFAPILLAFALAIKQLPELKNWRKYAIIPLLLILGNVMFNAAYHNNRDRSNPNDRALQCSINYEGSDKWLDSIGISRNAKILTLLAYPQNTPFIKMKRKGYTEMFFSQDIVDHVIQFNYDYIIIEDNIGDKLKKIDYKPERLERITGNGKLSIFKLRHEEH